MNYDNWILSVVPRVRDRWIPTIATFLSLKDTTSTGLRARHENPLIFSLCQVISVLGLNLEFEVKGSKRCNLDCVRDNYL